MPTPTTRPVVLDDNLVQQYHRDGYLIIEDVFRPDEIAALLYAVEHGERVAKTTVAPKDAAGKAAKLAIWFDTGTDIWSGVYSGSTSNLTFTQTSLTSFTLSNGTTLSNVEGVSTLTTGSGNDTFNFPAIPGYQLSDSYQYIYGGSGTDTLNIDLSTGNTPYGAGRGH